MSASTPHAPVTVAVTRRTAHDGDPRMLAWVHAGTALAERFDGFLGTGWARSSGDGHEWHMLYRFVDEEHLRAWEESPERQWWLSSGEGMVEPRHGERRVGIEGWFDEPTHVVTTGPENRREIPPRWKQAVMIWSVFFPLSVIANYLLGPLITPWPLPLRVLATTVVLTPVMTYVMLPFATRVLDRWLHAV